MDLPAGRDPASDVLLLVLSRRLQRTGGTTPWRRITTTCTATRPTRPTAALLLIDVINDLEFPEGDQLLRHALPMAERLAGAEAAGQASRHPGRSTSTTTSAAGGRTSTPRSSTASSDGVPRPADRRAAARPTRTTTSCSSRSTPGSSPRRSTSCSTTSGVETVILTGHRRQHLRPVHRQRRLHARLTHSSCPRDCVASNTEEENRNALEQMKKVLKADTRPSTELDLRAFRKPDASQTQSHAQPTTPRRPA